jgi:zinc protease
MLDDYVKKLNAVSADQVQKVARKYLVERSLTVAVLDPLPMAKGQRLKTPRQGDSHVR